VTNEKVKYIHDKRMPWIYFHLPFDKPFSKKVVLDLGEVLVTFMKDGEILNFYTNIDDNSVFILSYDFEVERWMMWLHDDNIDWIPEDGCEWRFICNNISNSSIILDEKGTLEFKDAR
jgi:hypothetical protein